jgi:zinc transporter 2
MKKVTRLSLAIGLSVTFMILEVIGGFWSGSLAIMSDAVHLLTDVAGFGIALIATLMAMHPASKNYTYGLARAEVLGALGSIITVLIMSMFLMTGAYIRFMACLNGTESFVDGKIMFMVACLGVVVNICLATVFMEDHGGAFHAHDHGHGHGHDEHIAPDRFQETVDVETTSSHGGHDHGHGHGHGHDHVSNSHDHGHAHESTPLVASYGSTTTKPATSAGGGKVHNHDDHKCSSHGHGHGHDVNISAAYLHVITDLIQSIGVAFAGALIWMYPEWQIIDPICTFAFCILVVWSTLSLLNRVVNILFEGVPSHLDYHEVLDKLKAIEGVQDVHDVHIWSISSSSIALTCHITARDPDKVLRAAIQVATNCGIQHPTIQVQSFSDPDSFRSICCTDAQQAHCM